ncbi:MAG: plastocyanin/azurin family copper-binding protein [Verrucomicrobiota bacterium]
MRKNFRTHLGLLLALLALPLGLSAQDSKPKVKKVKVKTVEGLRFDPVRFTVKRGEMIELKLENHDPNDQPHNFVLIKKGTLSEIQAASMVVGADSMEKGFVPDSDAVLVKSGLLNPDEKETIKFQAPKEKGIYHYVCTFPGHALIMYGALYVDEKYKDELAYDLNVPEFVRTTELEKLKALMEVERPSYLRLFMPDAGPAAIAVALPEKQNICWDAGNCRLRYAWSGAFVDATRMWNSNGNSLAKLLGDKYWETGGGETTYGLQIGEESTAEVHYKGYSLVAGTPEFHYEIDGTSVSELITSSPEGLTWRFEIDSPKGDVRVLAPDSDEATVMSLVGQRDGDFWVVPQMDASEFSLQLTKK